MKKMILMQTSMSAFTQLNAKNYIRLIRNATLKMEYAGKQILVDPLLGAKDSSVSALGVNPNPRVNLTMPVEEVLDGLDFTLLTHNHPDHYDETAVKLIRKDMPWFVQTALSMKESPLSASEVIMDVDNLVSKWDQVLVTFSKPRNSQPFTLWAIAFGMRRPR